ncbi:MAG: hypothetical protein GKR87_01695 [Kiritimatiellae bacterium]|nr:hypothetical protein [Kiritimatiellia bacterium]
MKKQIIFFIITAALIVTTGSVSLAQTSDIITVTATVGLGTNTLSVEPASISFGSITATPTDHRFEAPAYTVTVFAANGPWRIEAFTENPADAQGLESTDGQNHIVQFKLNQPGFGSGDPEDDTNFTGNSSVYALVGNAATNPAVYAFSSNDTSAGDIIGTFAIDAVGSAATTYSSDVRFQLTFF